MQAQESIGKQIGRLFVIRRNPKNIGKQIAFECRCDCGTIVIVTSANLGRSTNSCGCLRFDTKPNQTHGRTQTTEYFIWKSMRQRCLSPNAHAYADYGGRGITICEPWSKFENFYADMGDRPSKKHSLDRKDNDKGYSPENCRWATGKEQAKNRRVQSRYKQMVEIFGLGMRGGESNGIMGFGI